MAWRTGPNSALGVTAFNPSTPDSTPGGAAGTPIGTVVRAYEDTLGPCELIYLPGVAGLVAADAVSYDLTPGAQAVTRHSNANPNSGKPLAVAVGAPQAGQYGWFIIEGVAPVNVVAGAAIGAPFGSATPGSLTSVAANGLQVLGARLTTAIGTPAAGQAYLTLNRPLAQGQVT